MRRYIIMMSVIMAVPLFAFAGASAAVSASDSDDIRGVLDRVRAGYERGQAAMVGEMVADDLPERGRLMDTVERELFDYQAVRLSYTVDRQAYDGAGGAVWDVRWEWRAMDRNGTPVKGVLPMSLRFARRAGGWRITGIEPDNILTRLR